MLFVLLILTDVNQTLKFIEARKAAKILWYANHTDYYNKICALIFQKSAKRRLKESPARV